MAKQFELAVVWALAIRCRRATATELGTRFDANMAYDLGWIMLRHDAEQMTALERERLLTAVAELERDRNAPEIIREMGDSFERHVTDTRAPDADWVVSHP